MNTINGSAASHTECAPMTSQEPSDVELTVAAKTRIDTERAQVLERLQALAAMPKATPPYATLLDCLLDKLSCDQMRAGVQRNKLQMRASRKPLYLLGLNG